MRKIVFFFRRRRRCQQHKNCCLFYVLPPITLFSIPPHRFSSLAFASLDAGARGGQMGGSGGGMCPFRVGTAHSRF
jgi:hypothetical protein